uniref:HTH_Tnp_4 domain-containing protein n=1 Tax=Ascaris lumbricoides TaxID=6252 RepID=A0A0M3I1S0_ASCLU
MEINAETAISTHLIQKPLQIKRSGKSASARTFSEQTVASLHFMPYRTVRREICKLILKLRALQRIGKNCSIVIGKGSLSQPTTPLVSHIIIP